MENSILFDLLYFKGLGPNKCPEVSEKRVRIVVGSCSGRVLFRSSWFIPASDKFKEALAKWIDYEFIDLEYKYTSIC